MLYSQIFTGLPIIPSLWTRKSHSSTHAVYQTSRRGTEFHMGGRTESNAEMVVGIETIFSLLIFFYYRNFITPLHTPKLSKH